jgi:hypothetical protein
LTLMSEFLCLPKMEGYRRKNHPILTHSPKAPDTMISRYHSLLKTEVK